MDGIPGTRIEPPRRKGIFLGRAAQGAREGARHSQGYGCDWKMRMKIALRLASVLRAETGTGPSGDAGRDRAGGVHVLSLVSRKETKTEGYNWTRPDARLLSHAFALRCWFY